MRESATGALSTFMPGLPTTCTVTKSTELGIFVDVQVWKIQNERLIFMILLSRDEESSTQIIVTFVVEKEFSTQNFPFTLRVQEWN